MWDLRLDLNLILEQELKLNLIKRDKNHKKPHNR